MKEPARAVNGAVEEGVRIINADFPAEHVSKEVCDARPLSPRPLDEKEILGVWVLEEPDRVEILDRLLDDGEGEIVVGHRFLAEAGDLGQRAVCVEVDRDKAGVRVDSEILVSGGIADRIGDVVAFGHFPDDQPLTELGVSVHRESTTSTTDPSRSGRSVPTTTLEPPARPDSIWIA